MIVMVWVPPRSRRGARRSYAGRFASTSTAMKKSVTNGVVKKVSGGGGGAVVVPDAAPPSRPPSKPASDVLAGATARAASQATIHPLDTLKVRMQAGASKAAKSATPGGFGNDPCAAMKNLGKNMGSLYKGVLGAAGGAGIAIGAYFAVYSVATNIIARRTNLKPAAVAFVGGGVAAAGSSVVKVPLAVCIRSVQAGVYKNVFHAAKSIVAAAGPRGLFTGFLPTVLEDIPDMAFKFASYETLRSLHKAMIKDRNATPQEDFMIGAFAGAFAAAATTPLDVIKTNMMCSAASKPNMMMSAGAVLRNDGLKGFFRGVGPRAASNGINSAMFFCFFEALRTVINKKMKDSKNEEVLINSEG
ncbi:hypothetical protein BSKO_02007 [Bryopsis sp. KO-2023]|nr:hypothetical protein BSKO_02007 [Bryopsis sp. KO-2023]